MSARGCHWWSWMVEEEVLGLGEGLRKIGGEKHVFLHC